MEIISTSLPEVKIVAGKRHRDARGFFSETYNRAAFEKLGIVGDFRQDNHSRSEQIGTLRGLHFQKPPHAQAKLVRVVRGAVFDVAVDIRHGSPTFGKFVSAILTDENWLQTFVPAGFAHGFMTIEPATEIIYKVDSYFAPESDSGLIWNDPEIGIDWPNNGTAPILSQKDSQLGRLADLPNIFPYDVYGPSLD